MQRYSIITGLVLIIAFFSSINYLTAQLNFFQNSVDNLSLNGPLPLSPEIILLKKDKNGIGLSTDVQTTVNFNIKDKDHDAKMGNTLLFLGATSRATVSNISSDLLFQEFRNIGKPSPSLFRNGFDTQNDFSISYNYGVLAFASVKHLSKSKTPEAGEKEYFGEMTIQFNRNVTNPSLHINGLGNVIDIEGIVRGFSVELELKNPGLSLHRLSGCDFFDVSDTYIGNSANNMGAYYGTGAASGSVLVEGSQISEIVFDIYLKRDQREKGYRKRWPLIRNSHPGDGFLVSVSFEYDCTLEASFHVDDMISDMFEDLDSDASLSVQILDAQTKQLLSEKSISALNTVQFTGLTTGSDYLIRIEPDKSIVSRELHSVLSKDRLEFTANSSDSRLTREDYNLYKLRVENKQQSSKIHFNLGPSKEYLANLLLEQAKMEDVDREFELDQEIVEIDRETNQDSQVPLLQSDSDEMQIESEKPRDQTPIAVIEAINDERSIAVTESVETPTQLPVAIILGSFTERSNADRMEKRLINKGFQVYRGAGPVEFNRVGYLLKEGEDVEKLLIKFKKEIVSDAWLLDFEDIINRNSSEELIGLLGAISRPGNQE